MLREKEPTSVIYVVRRPLDQSFEGRIGRMTVYTQVREIRVTNTKKRMQFTTSSSSPQSLFSVSRERNPILRPLLSKEEARLPGIWIHRPLFLSSARRTIFKARPLNRHSPFNERVFTLYSASFRRSYVIFILRANDITMKL